MTVGERWSAHESPLAVVGKIVAVFAIVGAGIGGATLIFLSATGFFDATASDDLEAIGDLFLGGIALATLLVVSLVVGIVLAALGGLYAGHKSPGRGISAAVGAIAGTLGHIALVAALGLFLIVGVEALDSDETEAAPTPVPTQSAQDIASCEQAFGVGSELCRNETEDASTDDEGGGVSFEDIFQIGLGLIPAAAVGGLSGALGFTRRTTVIADVPVIVETPARTEPSGVRVGQRARKLKPAAGKGKPAARKAPTRRPRPPKPAPVSDEPSDALTAEISDDDLTDDFPNDLPEPRRDS